ncbi:MAG TPA: hypothetical protein DEA55_09610 [Rhodospirillaceae bacterium]|nr:hypothetical protein [Rhodospirillaceae bacterium]
MATIQEIELSIMQAASTGNYTKLKTITDPLTSSQKALMSSTNLGIALCSLGALSPSTANAAAIRDYMVKFSAYLTVDNRSTGNTDMADAIGNMAAKGNYAGIDAITDNMSSTQRSQFTRASYDTTLWQLSTRAATEGSPVAAVAAINDFRAKMTTYLPPVANTFAGTSGDDVIFVDSASDTVNSVGAGFDTVVSTVSFKANTTALNSTLEQIILAGSATSAYGNNLNNVIHGNASANTLYGYGGSDLIYGGAGADSMYGGTGDDFYSVDNVSDVVVELVNEGYDIVESSVSFDGSTAGLMNSLENIYLTGTARSATGNNLDNFLLGNEVANVLVGMSGSDDLQGLGGDDTIWGDGGGNMAIASGDDILSGGSGNDNMFGEGGNDSLIGDDGNDGLFGGAGDDVLLADAGNDVLDGGAGADWMSGGMGDDIYIVDNVNDVVVESVGEGYDNVASSVSFAANTLELINSIEHIHLEEGTAYSVIGSNLNNWVAGNSVANLLIGLNGSDHIEGWGGNDVIWGDGGTIGAATAPGNDILYGMEGNDKLYGEAGNDVLVGSFGADTLTGGTGADRFMITAYDTIGGRDTITDFSRSQGDILDLSDILSGNDVNVLQNSINSFVFARNSGTNTILSVDVDGAAGPAAKVDIAVLQNVTNFNVVTELNAGRIDVTPGDIPIFG